MPTTMKEAMQNAIEPRMAIKLDRLGRYERDSQEVLKICYSVLKYKYETILDTKQGVIYIGKKV